MSLQQFLDFNFRKTSTFKILPLAYFFGILLVLAMSLIQIITPLGYFTGLLTFAGGIVILRVSLEVAANIAHQTRYLAEIARRGRSAQDEDEVMSDETQINPFKQKKS